MKAVFRRAACAAALLLCAMPGAAWADGYNQPAALGSNNVLWQQTSGSGTEAGEPLTANGDGVCGPSGPEVVKTRWYSFKGTGGPMLLTSVGSNFDTLIGFYNAPAPAHPRAKAASASRKKASRAASCARAASARRSARSATPPRSTTCASSARARRR